MHSVRKSSFELLRILCMLMILILHYNTGTESVAGGSLSLTGVRVAGGLTESLCIAAVNVYVLISGYFLSEQSFRPSRMIRLWLEVIFYTLLIPVVLLLLGGEISGTSLWTAIRYIFPVSTEHYWFITAYFIMLLFSPLLNAFIKWAGRRQMQVAIGLLLVHFCFLKSISPVQFVTDRMGYDFGWFMCLYLMAGYVRKYGCRIRTCGQALLLYGISSAGIFLLYLVLHWYFDRTGALLYAAGIPFHYNFILCLTAALGLFLAAVYAKPGKGKAAELICHISPYTLGVYLIHQHVDLAGKWYRIAEKITGSATTEDPLRYLLQMLVAVFATFIICIFIDAVRGALFDKAATWLRNTEISKQIGKIDALFQRENGI